MNLPEHLPDYEGASIVNLMSSIGEHFGISNPYLPSTILPQNSLSLGDTIVLIVIDGMGYQYLTTHGKGSNFMRYNRGRMTSVFPTTTAAAMTSFYSGVAPLNHGIPAWYTYLKEYGAVSTILPMVVRGNRSSLLHNKLQAKDIFQFESFARNLKGSSYTLFPKQIHKSPFSSYAVDGSKELSYSPKSPSKFFRRIRKLLRSIPSVYSSSSIASSSSISSRSSSKYIMGYWSGFDTIAHLHGIESEATHEHFQKIDQAFGEFVDHVRGRHSNVKIIVTADHGLIDSTKDQVIWLKDHPDLKRMMTLPFSGEARVPFFYVRAHEKSAFEKYMDTHFSDHGELYSIVDLKKQNFFGLGKEHPQFWDRIGDYILLLKDNFLFKDQLLGEKKEALIGNHGGLSRDELYVPLIIP
ncbi:MAG: alkaline phosphatase family protein [Promethearchaeota archaeon]